MISILCEQYAFCDRRFLLNFIAQRNLVRVRSLAREATGSGRALALASRLPGKQLKVIMVSFVLEALYLQSPSV
jgi:hypothetical protein